MTGKILRIVKFVRDKLTLPTRVLADLFLNSNNAWESHGIRGGSRTAATSKMEHFVIIVNSEKPLTTILKRSILDVAAVLDPPLELRHENLWKPFQVTVVSS